VCLFSQKCVSGQSYSSLNLHIRVCANTGDGLSDSPKRGLNRDMRNFRISLLTTLLGLAFVMATAQRVSANSIIFAGQDNIKGAGFGHMPRALTIQSSGGPHNTTESGCIAPGLIAGNSACANTSKDVGGDEQNPIKFPKQAAPTVKSLGITSGSQIGILFDAIQPQGSKKNPSPSSVTINDLTLKLYNGSSLIYSVSGTFSPLSTNPGNGTTDYLFVLDPAAVTAFNAALGNNFTDTISLDSTISFPSHSAGPDSYLFANTAPIPSPTPEPTSMLLLGSSIVALVLKKGLGKA